MESADFRDLPSQHAAWEPGPNARSTGNVMKRRGEDEEWLWLSDGTDWQAFQGGMRVVSDVGIRPAWVTFQVRVATPEHSGANLALSSREAGWALHRPTVFFSYRGDDFSQPRCFLVETCLAEGGIIQRHPCPLPGGVSPDEVYKIAIHLDWAMGLLSVFINGRAHVQAAAFGKADPICLAAIYNWRSHAVTGFSELMLGSTCPYEVDDPLPCSRLQVCAIRCRQARHGPRASSLAEAMVVLGVAVLAFAFAAFVAMLVAGVSVMLSGTE